MMRRVVLIITILLVAASVAMGHDEPLPCVSQDTCESTLSIDFASVMIGGTASQHKFIWAFDVDSYPGITVVTINGEQPIYDHGNVIGGETSSPTAMVLAGNSAGNVDTRSFALSSHFTGRPAVKLEALRRGNGFFSWLLRPIRRVRSLRINGQLPQRIADRLQSTSVLPSIEVTGRDPRGRRFKQHFALISGALVQVR